MSNDLLGVTDDKGRITDERLKELQEGRFPDYSVEEVRPISGGRDGGLTLGAARSTLEKL